MYFIVPALDTCGLFLFYFTFSLKFATAFYFWKQKHDRIQTSAQCESSQLAVDCVFRYSDQRSNLQPFEIMLKTLWRGSLHTRNGHHTVVASPACLAQLAITDRVSVI